MMKCGGEKMLANLYLLIFKKDCRPKALLDDLMAGSKKNGSTTHCDAKYLSRKLE